MNDYSTTLETQFNTMRTQISSSLEKAQDQRDALKRTNFRYIRSNIILSALATLLAGMAGTIGNAQNWKITCLFAGVCPAGVTASQ
ncbi:hypothetical protein ACKFKH_29560 [Phormidesmis sp. 146-20]